MKRFLLALAIVLLPGVAAAQSVYGYAKLNASTGAGYSQPMGTDGNPSLGTDTDAACASISSTCTEIAIQKAVFSAAGTPADTAWDGSSSTTSIVGALKYIGTNTSGLTAAINNLTTVAGSSIPAGTNSIGSVGIQVNGAAVTTANPTPVSLVPSASTGWTYTTIVAAASDNKNIIKASPGSVGGWSFVNTTAAALIVKLYDQASGPAPASNQTIVPIVIPANSSVSFHAPQGISFLTGIGLAITANLTNHDDTAVTAGAVYGSIWWK